ncbi:hypothetical protein [Octadecabacter ascidiaceicola]|uniref:Uncharacterized protein n=1 Tax=Octadecabacter ascidiaceicola TaxID=1655543 RepID=A0A238K979_9RHOB|nr:hypothetical protein [Octadecabacter ascidiaceicola]SMX39409.1 hypothetical protein OCA8868_01961 [Octadecabacter ascidiaceicola]
MNSIITTKILSHTHTFADRTWYYDFRELFDEFEEGKIKTNINGLSQRYSKITKDWSSERNSEWICRIYLSAKMILSATLQLEALLHAKQQNLRVVAPYLEYYTFLALVRAVVYTLPEVEWDDGKLVAISHSKAINIAFDELAKYDQGKSQNLKRLTLDLKANRELISYRSPSSGDGDLVEHDDIIPTATLLAELAQMNSELLERSILKKAREEDYVFLPQYAAQLSEVTIEDRNFFDREDHNRLGYLRRKYPLPPNIMHVMTEGHVEDYFGAWCADEDNPDVFDPDHDWRLIFNVP